MDYKTFEDFYPFYLSQHVNQTNRRLHVIGTLLAIFMLIRAVFNFSFLNLLMVPLVGYGFAWVGHFVYEKNKPATFKYPLFSFRGDLRLLYETLTGKLKF